MGKRWQLYGIGEDRLSLGVTVEKRQLDGGGLQFALGLDELGLAQRDQLPIVQLHDTLQIAAADPFVDLGDTLLGESQERALGFERLACRHPLPVGLRRHPNIIQQLDLHRRIDGGPRQSCLCHFTAPLVNNPVLEQRQGDAESEFTSIVRLPLLVPGLKRPAA